MSPYFDRTTYFVLRQKLNSKTAELIIFSFLSCEYHKQNKHINSLLHFTSK